MIKKWSGIVSYNIGFVTFFDILGFKKLIETKSYDEMKAIIDNFYKTNLNSISKVGEYDFSIETISFSDSVVRVSILSENYSQKDYCNALLNELTNLSCIQMELIKSGVLIRGGISFGEIYYNSNDGVVFGVGLNDAYKLESELANYPRIIIDPNILDELEDYLDGDDKETIFNIMKCLSLDKDGVFFIDYLKQSMSLQYFIQEHYFGKVNENIFYEDMKAHKKLIIENIDMKMDLKLQQKYNWLTSYHNEINLKSYEDVLPKSEAAETLILDDDNPLYRNYINTCYMYK